MAVERLLPGDWRRMRAVRLAALLDAPEAFSRTHAQEAAYDEGVWRSRLTDPSRASFVAVVDGVDVGLVGVGPHPSTAGDAGIYSVWVAPEVRGSGVAAALLEAACEWARAAGFERARLWVIDGNRRAARFYARMGFTPTGAVQPLSPPREQATESELVRLLV